MKNIITKQTIKAFGDYLIDNERASATVEKYLRDVRFFADYIGIASPQKTHVLAYKEMLLKSYAIRSANSMLASLNAYFRFLGRYDLIVKQFKVQKEAYCPEEKELTREEYASLIRTADKRNDQRLSLIIQTICATGIRVSELKSITVEAVRRGEATVSLKGKTRKIFIVSALRQKLTKYIKEQGLTEGTVFTTKGGKPIDRSNIWKQMKALCEDAKVLPEKVFPHNLRHLFARTFYKLEKDIARLADILGHSSINTTRIYIISSGKEHQRRMENMHLII